MAGSPTTGSSLAGAGDATSRALAPLERLSLVLPEAAVPAFAAALECHADSVGFFRDEASGQWTLEAIRRPGERAALATALALAAAAAGIEPPEPSWAPIAAAGWLEKVAAGFPPQRIGRRWLVLGTHDAAIREAGRIPIVLDAGLAFGSGEHGSTRGCLRALERLPRPRAAILDLGTGSGILAIAAAKLFRRKVLATDIEPWSVRVAAANARANLAGRLVRAAHERGVARRVRAGAPYGLVLANILARPLCAMARPLAATLAPGGRIVLAGLLAGQANQVGLAWRRQGAILRRRIGEGNWTTLVLQAPWKPTRRPPTVPEIAV